MASAEKPRDPEWQRAVRLPDTGYMVCVGPSATAHVIEATQRHLVDLGMLQVPIPLADLHHHLPPETMALNEHYTNAVSRAFYAPVDGIVCAYHDLIAHLYRYVIPDDFLFQAQPIVRFHFPVQFPPTLKTKKGVPRQLHSDILGGHPRQMLQGWVALCDCDGSAALQCSTQGDGLALLDRYHESLGPDAPPFADSLQHFYGAWDRLPGFAEALTLACKPISMSAGDVLFFDPHCIHGGTENEEGSTRVSLDFRLLPVSQEKALMANAETPTQKRFRRGVLFHRQSAAELAGN